MTRVFHRATDVIGVLLYRHVGTQSSSIIGTYWSVCGMWLDLVDGGCLGFLPVLACRISKTSRPFISHSSTTGASQESLYAGGEQKVESGERKTQIQLFKLGKKGTPMTTEF